MPDFESKLNKSEIDILVKALTKRQNSDADVRELVVLAAFLGYEAFDKERTAEDEGVGLWQAGPEGQAMDARSRRIRVAQREAAARDRAALAAKFNLPPRVRHV